MVQERDPLIKWVTFRFGVWYGRCSRSVTGGLEMCVLDGVSTRSLTGFGCESLWQGSVALGFQMGTAQGIYPWVITLVMGNLMGRRFWVGSACFFSTT